MAYEHTSNRFTCPDCGGPVRAIDSRLREHYRVRRYVCQRCALRFSSVEVALPAAAAISGHAGVLDVLAGHLLHHARSDVLLGELGRRITHGLLRKKDLSALTRHHAGEET